MIYPNNLVMTLLLSRPGITGNLTIDSKSSSKQRTRYLKGYKHWWTSKTICRTCSKSSCLEVTINLKQALIIYKIVKTSTNSILPIQITSINMCHISKIQICRESTRNDQEEQRPGVLKWGRIGNSINSWYPFSIFTKTLTWSWLRAV